MPRTNKQSSDNQAVVSIGDRAAHSTEWHGTEPHSTAQRSMAQPRTALRSKECCSMAEDTAQHAFAKHEGVTCIYAIQSCVGG